MRESDGDYDEERESGESPEARGCDGQHHGGKGHGGYRGVKENVDEEL